MRFHRARWPASSLVNRGERLSGRGTDEDGATRRRNRHEGQRYAVVALRCLCPGSRTATRARSNRRVCKDVGTAQRDNGRSSLGDETSSEAPRREARDRSGRARSSIASDPRGPHLAPFPGKRRLDRPTGLCVIPRSERSLDPVGLPQIAVSAEELDVFLRQTQPARRECFPIWLELGTSEIRSIQSSEYLTASSISSIPKTLGERFIRNLVAERGTGCFNVN